jgi:hypothetical protein
VQVGNRGVEKLWSPSRKPENILALWSKQMAHIHGNEYQVIIVHANGAEELSGWMNSQDQLAQAMAAIHRAQGNSYWLRERIVFCPDCVDQEQQIVVECPIAYTPSPRCRPHDSRYLVAVGSKNRYESLAVAMGSSR